MNVLFVDDQSSVLDGIAACIHFEKLGIERAFYASSAAGALERLSVHPIDVVLTDIEMPGEDGIWLIRTIRERYPESLTVMLTSHADFEYAQESIRLGCFDYLVQPAPPEEIERVLQRAMQYLYERNKRNQLYEVGRRMQTGAMELLDGVAMNLFSARKEEIRASLELLELLGYPVAEEKHARLLMLTFEQFRRSDTPTVSEKEIHKHLAQALKEAEFSFPIVSLSTVNHEKQFVLLLFSALEDVPELAVDRLHDFFERLCKAIPKEVIRCFVGGAAPFKALWSEYRHVRDVIDGKLEDTGILRWEYEASHPSAADSVYITGSGARWRSLLASGQHRILMNEFEQKLFGQLDFLFDLRNFLLCRRRNRLCHPAVLHSPGHAFAVFKLQKVRLLFRAQLLKGHVPIGDIFFARTVLEHRRKFHQCPCVLLCGSCFGLICQKGHHIKRGCLFRTRLMERSVLTVRYICGVAISFGSLCLCIC